MTRLLQIGVLPPALETRLAQRFDGTVRLREQADADAYLAAEGAAFDAVVTSGRFGASAALMDRLPKLKVIASMGVGYDTIDIDAARARGVAVSNTPDVLNDCVADTAIALVLDVARGISASDRFVRRGDWQRGQYPLMTRVSGKKLGIVGLGRIGRVIAKRAAAFDMEVRYHNRRPVDDAPGAYEPTLAGLARWCDFLVLVVAGGAATRHLVSAEVLDALGPQAYLINVARGSVVDEPALVAALQQGRIAGAGLDVFDDEPNVPEALLALDNVVLLPHVASATHETRAAMAALVFDNLEAWDREGRLLTPVV